MLALLSPSPAAKDGRMYVSPEHVSDRFCHTGAVPAQDHERLARYVRERREELGLTQEEVATRGGPSTATLRLIENAAGAAYKAKSLRQLEDGLGWARGSAIAVLGGGVPSLATAAVLTGEVPVELRHSLDVLASMRPRVRRAFTEFMEAFAEEDDPTGSG